MSEETFQNDVTQQINLYTVGWVDMGTGTKVPLRFVTYLSKVNKINEKSVSLVKTFWVMHYIEVKTFSPQYGLHGYQKMQNFT
jgi:hypothetical protein